MTLALDEIVMGTWQLGGGWGALTQEAVDSLLREARNEGVRTFDTARGYGDSERAVGAGLREVLDHDRDSVILATKGGFLPRDGGGVRDSSRAALRDNLQTSLRVLGVEYVDVYQLHWPDPAVPMGEVGQTFAELKAEGKIRAVGLANVTISELEEFAAECPVDVLQMPYNLMRREIESAMLPYAHQNGIPVMVYGALSHGLLVEDVVFAGGFSPGDWRLARPEFGRVDADCFAALARVARRAHEYGWTLPQIALAFCLRDHAADSVILGVQQVTDITAAREVLSKRDELQELMTWLESLSLPSVRMPPVFTDGKGPATIMER